MIDASVEAILECKDGSFICTLVLCDCEELRLTQENEKVPNWYPRYKVRRFRMVVATPPRVYREV